MTYNVFGGTLNLAQLNFHSAFVRVYTTDLQTEERAEVPRRTFFHTVEYSVRLVCQCSVFYLMSPRQTPVCSQDRRVRSA